MCLAVPGVVEAVYEQVGTRMGRVNFGGVVKEVCLEFVPELVVGDYALVHVGFAIARVDEASAQAALQTFEEIGRLENAQLENADSTAEGDAV